MNPTTHLTGQRMDVQAYFRYKYNCRHMSEFLCIIFSKTKKNKKKNRKKLYRCHCDAREMLMLVMAESRPTITLLHREDMDNECADQSMIGALRLTSAYLTYVDLQCL